MRKQLFGLFCIVSFVTYAQTENEMVIKAFQDAQALIVQKQYQSAQGRLEDMRVFGVYTDSIDFYMKVIDYHIDLDNVEVKYQKKRFQEARNLYDKIYPKHKDVITSTPTWVLRCDTIIVTQNQGEAITEKFANVINQNRSFYYLGDHVWKIWNNDSWFYINGIGDTIDYSADDDYRVINDHQVVNRKGEILLDVEKYNAFFPKYKEDAQRSNGLFIIEKKGGKKRGVIDLEGNIIVPMSYGDIDDISNGCILARKKLNEIWSGNNLLFNNKGEVICEDFIDCCFMNENRMWIMRGEDWCKKHQKKTSTTGLAQLIDTNGNVICEKEGSVTRWYFFKKFSDGLSFIKGPSNSDLYQCVDINGEIVIPPFFDDVRSFNKGYAKVLFHNAKDWKYINKKGLIVSEEEYEKAQRTITPYGYEEILHYQDFTPLFYLKDRFGTSTLDYK